MDHLLVDSVWQPKMCKRVSKSITQQKPVIHHTSAWKQYSNLKRRIAQTQLRKVNHDKTKCHNIVSRTNHVQRNINHWEVTLRSWYPVPDHSNAWKQWNSIPNAIYEKATATKQNNIANKSHTTNIWITEIHPTLIANYNRQLSAAVAEDPAAELGHPPSYKSSKPIRSLFVLPTQGKISSHSAFRFPYKISSQWKNIAAVWARFKLMAQRALRARPLTCWSHERKNLIWKTVQLLITLRPRPLRTLQLSSRIVTENVRLLRQKIQPPSWIIIPS
jgi:hypothetical protein